MAFGDLVPLATERIRKPVAVTAGARAL